MTADRSGHFYAHSKAENATSERTPSLVVVISHSSSFGYIERLKFSNFVSCHTVSMPPPHRRALILSSLRHRHFCRFIYRL